MATFYNTIGLTDQELTQARAQVAGQEKAILEVMSRAREALTPLQIEDILHETGEPILRSSVVRGLRNLVIAGLLVKTDELVIERYGKKNHLWKLAEPVKKGQGKLF